MMKKLILAGVSTIFMGSMYPMVDIAEKSSDTLDVITGALARFELASRAVLIKTKTLDQLRLLKTATEIKEAKEAKEAKGVEKKEAKPKRSSVSSQEMYYTMIARSHRAPESCLEFLLKILEGDFGITPANEKEKSPQEIDDAAQAIAKQLGLRKIDVNRIYDATSGYTLLHCAAQGVRMPVLSYHKKRQERQECNAVVLAVCHALVLCHAGSAVDAIDAINTKDRMSAMLIAADSGYANIVQTLLRFKASFDVCGPWKRTPLHSAAHNGHNDVVRILCQAALRALSPENFFRFINVHDKSKDTPLHLACARATIYANDPIKTTDYCDTISILFKYYADASSVNLEGGIPEVPLPQQVGKKSVSGTSTIDCPGARYGMNLWKAFETGYERQRATLE